MSNSIKPGDLMLCIDASTFEPHMLRDGAIYTCGRVESEYYAIAGRPEGKNCFRKRRFVKIGDFPELADERHDEEITA